MLTASPYDINRFVIVYDDLDLPQDFCDRIISTYEKLLSCGSGHCPSILSNSSFFPQENDNESTSMYSKSPKHELFDKQLVDQVNKAVNEGLTRYCVFHPTLSNYYKNDTASNNHYQLDFYIKKTNPSKKDSRNSESWNIYSTRKDGNLIVNWVLFLNDLQDNEGNLEFMEFDKKIRAKENRLIIFPSDWSYTYRVTSTSTTTQYFLKGTYGYFP